MTDCSTALGQEGVGTDQLSYTYASSLGIAFQAAPMELFSGELTRAYESGGDSAPCPPNTREEREEEEGWKDGGKEGWKEGRKEGRKETGGCGVVGGGGFPGRFQERIYTVISPSLHIAYHLLLRAGFPYGGIPYV
ncbi:hypothetical protein PAMP_014008 [Pampus punctatissimus]